MILRPLPYFCTTGSQGADGMELDCSWKQNACALFFSFRFAARNLTVSSHHRHINSRGPSQEAPSCTIFNPPSQGRNFSRWILSRQMNGWLDVYEGKKRWNEGPKKKEKNKIR